ncbi:MAG TPA: alpha/beta hydrolase [Candidatus Limnocylindria bacterium]|nr:alpha/beta hydrolase [Candidatus Limnocylindria bacterium]
MGRDDELRVSAGEATLVGTLTLPDEPAPTGRYPNVLLLPSWLPRDRDGAWDRSAHAAWFAPASDGEPGLLARLAGALAKYGVASLRVDPRGCAASEGAWESTPLFTKIDDARDMLSALRAQPQLDLRRTGIVGHGEGATLALSVAIGDPAVSALTLIGPSARSWRDVLRRGVGERARTGTDRQHPGVAALDRWSEEIIERAERREARFELPIAGAGSVPLALAGVEQAIHTPPLALATMLHRSVALVHGANDAWADPDESVLLADALAEGGNEVAHRVVPGAGHDLAEAPGALMGEVAADLAARIRPVELPPVLVAIEEMTDGVR